jgi:dTDP-4-amino-4,6-dideoxygalactose transaminase
MTIVAKMPLALHGGEKAAAGEWPSYPVRTEEELRAIADAYWRTGIDSIQAGGVIGEFEEAWAAYHGVKRCIATSGGSTALHLGLAVMGIGPGDEVITSPYSFGATAACILHANAIPVFADIEETTLGLDPAAVERAITPQTRAIVVVHFGGMPASMEPLLEVARSHDLAVIEDCAQAHGATYKGQKVGTIGDIGAFSHQSTKATPSFEGGSILTNSGEHYQRGLVYAMHTARQQEEVGDCDWAAYIDSTAFNHRMNSLAAAMAKSQLGHVEERNAWRIKNSEHLYERLRDVPGVEPVWTPSDRVNVHYFMAFRYRSGELGGLPRERYIEALEAEGVPVLTYVKKPIHLRRRFQDRFLYPRGCPWTCGHAQRDVQYNEGDCPVAERICANEELVLPAYRLAADHRDLMDRVADAFTKVAEQHGTLLGFG